MESFRQPPPGVALAEEAHAALRRLRHETGGRDLESPAELYRTLGLLHQLADDLSQVLPSLHDQLERALLAGRLQHTALAATARETIDAVASAGHSMSVAHYTGLLVSQELRKAHAAVRDLAAP
ncbi:hypothetical protein [Amycolatopsis jiangsuensis]|uniref:Uncharacterized protein n=1 Tax=Amycolatopsis jiangsuensis TaxID=1181879 RepID=A0A840J6S4_9PSEU|nr:hypothetical protein [Amycolatopsis jiangsuensis]MBB4689132.1 hypothetical protein [Amycolatopsis jiangsuensis]